MKVIKERNDYFPTGEIWLVFDQNNGHPGSKQYVWWFRTKKEANEHIRHCKRTDKGFGVNVSAPTLWKDGSK
jgi:hypothetical protein